MKKIIVTIAKDGSTKVETKGFAGTSCQAASADLEKALGIKQSEKLTAEYFAQQTTAQQVQEGA
jgi:hypothetical protein